MGLSEKEAARRLAVEGPNELPDARARTFQHLAGEVLREPMLLLLVGCGAVYFVLGDWREALVLLAFLLIVAAIALVQEQRTQRALDSLRDLSSPRALVIRDGVRRRIAGRSVVRGDWLVVSEGDRVPADARVLEAENLHVDESLLTGESVPVRKSVADGDAGRVFAGTLVTRGRGVAEAVFVGPGTEMGRIGRRLQTVRPERTRLQRETSRLVGRLALGAAGLCVLVAVGYAWTRADWLGGILAGLTLAMAILPNEFPAILAIFLALGAWRLSRQGVLTRRIPAVEALGTATVLCVDKTGTLTQNRMEVRRLVAGGRFYEVPPEGKPLPEEAHEVAEYAVLASQRDPFDPMEKAFHELGLRGLAGTEHLHPGWELVREYPLSDALLALSQVWRSPDGDEMVIAAKGAPEAIADLCHLPRARGQALGVAVDALASDGLRVLGFAKARFASAELPAIQHDFDFELVGLAGLADPVRPGVPAAIGECQRAGVRVLLITGDHPLTARSVAREIGLAASDSLLTGRELADLSDEQLRERVRTTAVFARVVPEQKLRLVRALHANGDVVAMTGDGVNDAPALKAAAIGIAMGGRGTDVARESAALVLLEDDFASLVQAIRVGRRTDDNLRSAMSYVLAVHVPIVGLSLVPALFGYPLVLLPVQVAFLHLIIEPACSVVFEAEAEAWDTMRRPPRPPDAPLFDRRLLARSLAPGLSVFAVTLALLVWLSRLGSAQTQVRGQVFATLVLASVALIFSSRPWTTLRTLLLARNRALAWVVGGALSILALILYVPPLRALFQMSLLHADDLALSLGLALFGVLVGQAPRLFTRRGASLFRSWRQR